MYNLVPADSEARKRSSIEPVNVPDRIMHHPHSKKSSQHSDNVVKKKNSDPRCDICGKTYKNKNSLGAHNDKRRYHSKLSLRLSLHESLERFNGQIDRYHVLIQSFNGPLDRFSGHIDRFNKKQVAFYCIQKYCS